MQRKGRVRYAAANILMLIGAYTLADGLLEAVSKLGWMHWSGASILDIVLWGVIVGALGSELHWLDMKRRFRKPPPEEDWMTR